MWVTLNIDSAKADNPDLLEFIGMGIDMEIWPMETDSLSGYPRVGVNGPYLFRTNHLLSHLF